MASKGQVDLRVSRMLSRCSNVSERKKLGLEIAKMYVEIGEFKIARGFVEQFLQLEDKSAPGLLCLGRIKEATGDPIGALRIYQRLFKADSCEKDLIIHACEMATELDIPADELEFWSNVACMNLPEGRITNVLKEHKAGLASPSRGGQRSPPLQLMQHAHNVDLCIKTLKDLSAADKFETALDLCCACVNNCWHFDSCAWFRACMELVELRTKNNPNLLCNEKIHLLYVLSSMMLLRLSASTSCVSDMHSYLEKLMLLLRRFTSSDKELRCISEEANVWVYFYTGVLAQRCLTEVKNEPENIAIIRQFYLRAANSSTLHRYSEPGQLSSFVWEKLHLYRMEHRIQALFLSKRLAPSDAQQNFPHITSASWRELVNLLCTKANLKKASVETSELVSPEPCSRTLNAHQAEDLWEQSVDTMVLSPGNLDLLLWLCGQQLNPFDTDINDSLLSNNNLKWIFQVVSVLFKNVDLANHPVPFDNTGTVVEEFCQLDAVCFLIASFLYLMIRGNASKYSLCANIENPSDVIEWPDLPLCLLPHKLLPCSAQRRWWRAATDSFSREREASAQEAQRTFLRCGVGQLRLTSRPARCFGNQTGVLATPLVFRIAWGLSRFSKNYASPQQKHLVEDWAAGYWKAGLQFQLVGIPPSHFLQAYSRNQSLPSCSGSSTAFCESFDRSSPFSPVQNASPKSAHGQVATHLLFNLPSDYSWWMGVRPNCLTNEALVWQWCNTGMTNLLSRLKQRYGEQSHRLSKEQKQELCFLTQLLDLDSENISPDVYALGGQLLMDVSGSSSSRDRDVVNVTPSICENPVKDLERARHYLDKGADKMGTKKNTLAGFTSCKSEGNWFLPDYAHESTPLRNRPAFVSTLPKSSTTGSHPKGASFSSANISTCGCNHLGSDAPQTPSTVPHLPVTHPLTTLAAPCNTPAVQSSVPLGEGRLDDRIAERINTQFNSLTESQDLLMSGFINSWHALVNGLSSQLAETKSELCRSRQLNEQLSRQLDETNKQLLDAIGKFTEVHQKSSKSYSDDSSNRTSEPNRLLETSIRELIQLICELRRWLPEGMAAAATAAVNAHFALGTLPSSRPGPFISTAEAAALMQLYGAGAHMPQAQFPNLGQFQTPPASHSYATAFQEPTSMPTADPRMSKSLGGFANPVGAFVGNQVSGGLAAHAGRPLDSSAGLSASSSTVQDASSSASGWKNGLPLNSLAQPFTDPRFSGPRPLQTAGTLGSSQSIPPPNYTGLFPPRGPLTATATSVAMPSTLSGAPFPPSSLITSPRDVGVPSTSYEKPKPLPQSNLFRPPATSVRSNTTSPEINKQSGNHAVTPELKLSLPEKNEQMAIWAVRDVAEPSQGKDETFMIQLKSPELLERFVKSVSEGNSQVTPSDKPTVSSEVTKSPTPTRTETSTAGKTEDLRKTFAPKPGEWTCSVCCVVNPASARACVACETPASGGQEKKTSPKTTSTDSFAAKFAPQPGSWDCPTCLLNHAKDVEVCPACHTRKPGLLPAPSTTAAKSTAPAPLFGGFTMSSGGFVFGQAKTTTATSSTQSTPTKPLFSFVASSGKPASTVVTPATPTTFSFGLKATTDTPKFKSDEKPTPTSLFSSGKPLSSTSSTTPERKTESTDKASSAFSALDLTEGLSKPAQGGGFTFTFGQPAAPNLQTVSSPPKSGDEQDSDRVEPVDEDHLKFKPALEVMPEKVTVRTGEENEEVIFCERAKLYRWDSKDWRERGVGEIKLLRAPSGSVRCLMRRDHILKVCCNHPITTDMHLKPMSATDARRWTWWAIDFTELAPEEELDKSQEAGSEIPGGRRETFAVRFKTAEQAAEFKRAFDDAVKEAERRAGRPTTEKEKVEPAVKAVDLDQESTSSDEVVIVEKPPQVNEDQLARARRLQLPDQFYEYENGCVSGEREPLTSAEEAEEDALLDAAIRRGNTQTAKNGANLPDGVSGDIKANKPASHEAEAAVETAKPSEQNRNNLGSPLTTSGNLSTTYIPQAQGLTDFSSLSAAVSKDSKPSWTIPSSGPSNSSNIWAAAGTQLFTKSQSTHEGRSEVSANTAEESEEVDPHYDPIVPLPELVQTKSGEEDELCLFLQRCRVYRFVDNAWKERGVGDMKVLVLPESYPAGAKPGSREIVKPEVNLGKLRRARLLMRRDQVFKICVNQPIGVDLPNFKPMGSGGKSASMCWVGDDYSEGTASHELLSIRFKKESDAEEFKAAVKRAQSCLEKPSSS